MIDVHCHILPMVDDGPKSMAEAEAMLKMAYEDGIRTIVATPHRHHPMFEVTDEAIFQAFQALKERASFLFPEMTLVLSSEYYLVDENISYDDLTKHGKYVLIEFQRHIGLEKAAHLVHELTLRGICPIIAHVEMYPAFVEDLDGIRRLRMEGGCIQITASSLIGKMGSDISGLLRRAIKLGLIDFVASDAHGDKKRRPLLQKTYRTVEKIAGKREAKRIFCLNPKAMLQEKPLIQSAKKGRRDFGKISSAQGLVLALALIGLIGFGAMTYASFVVEKKVIQEPETKHTLVMIETIKEGEERPPLESENKEFLEVQEAPVATETQAPVEAPVPTETQAPAQEQKLLTKEDIETDYYKQLAHLQTGYTDQIESYVAQIKSIRASEENKTLRKEKIDAIINQVLALESEVDLAVTALLYDMQTLLENHRYSVETVSLYRETYQQVKADLQALYLSGF